MIRLAAATVLCLLAPVAAEEDSAKSCTAGGALGECSVAAARVGTEGQNDARAQDISFPLSLIWPPSRETAPNLALLVACVWVIVAMALLNSESEAEKAYKRKRARQMLAQVAQTKFEHEESRKKWESYNDREAIMRKAASQRFTSLQQADPDCKATEESVYQQVIMETGFAFEKRPEGDLDPKRICEVMIDEIEDCPVNKIKDMEELLGPEAFKDLNAFCADVHKILLERLNDKLETTLSKTRKGFENEKDPRYVTFSSGIKLSNLVDIAKQAKKHFYPTRFFGMIEPTVTDTDAARFLKNLKGAKAMIKEIKRKQPMRIVQILGLFTKDTFWYMSLACLTRLCGGSINPSRHYLFQEFVNAGMSDNWQELIVYPILCLGVIFFLDWCVNDWLSIVSCAKATSLLKHTLKTRMFDAVMRQDTEYFEIHDASAITDRVQHDCTMVADNILFIPLDIMGVVSDVSFHIYLMYIYSPGMVPRTLSVGFIVGPLIIVMNKLTDAVRRKDDRTVRAMRSQADEMLNKVKAVREFSREKQEAAELDRGEKVCGRSIILLHLLSHIQNIIIFSILFGAEVWNYWYGASQVNAKLLNPQQMIQVGGFVYHITFCIRHLLGLLPRFMQMMIPAERIFLLLESKSLIEPMPGDKKPAFETKNGGIELEFKDVTFAYPLMPEITILHDLSLRIPSGKTVAICGERAAGKSTIYCLMQRMYDVEYGNGEIIVNGRSIKDWDVRSYRRAISILAQKGLLFKGTIKENVLYGLNQEEQRARNFHLPEGDQELQRLLEMSGAWDIVKQFPLKLEQRIGTGGVSLSGGTEQCLFIARGLVKQPAMLMMDEATSAMDTHTQKKAAEGIALEQKRLGFSVVQVAHRIETLTRSDLLFFVEHGKAVEVGGEKSLNGKACEELAAKKIEYEKILDPESGKEVEILKSGFYRQLHEAYYDLDFHKMSASALVRKVRALEEQLERARMEKEARLAPLAARLLPPTLDLDRAKTTPTPAASGTAKYEYMAAPRLVSDGAGAAPDLPLPGQLDLLRALTTKPGHGS